MLTGRCEAFLFAFRGQPMPSRSMKIPGNTANLTRTAGVIADRAGRLAKATTATIRRTLIHVPARLARSARRITPHPPKAWPWQSAFTRLILGRSEERRVGNEGVGPCRSRGSAYH